MSAKIRHCKFEKRAHDEQTILNESKTSKENILSHPSKKGEAGSNFVLHVLKVLSQAASL